MLSYIRTFINFIQRSISNDLVVGNNVMNIESERTFVEKHQ